MAEKIAPPHALATGVGALPHRDPAAACRDVLRIFPDFPYAPSLPNRGFLESIVYNDSEQLPGRFIEEGRLVVETGRDLSAAMEQIYLDFIGGNFARYPAGEEYASGFHAMVRHQLPGVFALKCQVTGPVTFGMQVVDRARKPLYYDTQFADVLGKMIALRARWCEVTMREKTGSPQTLVILNEPYLASLGSSVVPLDPEMVRSGWHDIASLVEGGLGIHCCSNTDWSFVIDLAPSVISIDAYTTADEFLLYSGQIAAYLERGGVIAWGIVPADYRIFVTETVDALFDRLIGIRRHLADQVPVHLFDTQCLITPSCGIQFADEAGACAIMHAAAEIAQRLRTLNGETA